MNNFKPSRCAAALTPFFVRAEINSFLVHHNQWAASFEHCELLFQYRFSDSISGAGENSILLEVNSEGQIRCNEEIRFTVQNQESGIYVDTLDDTSRRALIEQLTLDVTNAVLLQLYEDSFFEK